MKHRSSTSVRHLTSAFCLVPRKILRRQLCHSRASPGVLGSPSLSLPLWVPLQCPLDYMSIWSPQRMADPTPSSLSYLFPHRSFPCLSTKLLVADFSRPPNPQNVLQALIDEHLQLLQFLCAVVNTLLLPSPKEQFLPGHII